LHSVCRMCVGVRGRLIVEEHRRIEFKMRCAVAAAVQLTNSKVWSNENSRQGDVSQQRLHLLSGHFHPTHHLINEMVATKLYIKFDAQQLQHMDVSLLIDSG